MKKFVRYNIEAGDESENDIIVAYLSDLGIDAFEEQESSLVASGKNEEVLEDEVEQFLSSRGIKFEKALVEDQNWNAVWESSFEPVIIEDFLGIRAHFHEPVSGVEHEIVITPKMSFGTGHHATTWLMVQLMREIEFTGKTVFDFGTGTGLLAVLAERLGANKVLAIDNDEWSIRNAEENLKMNGCSKIELRLIDQPPAGAKFDVILANINKHILLEQMPSVSALASSGSIVLLSGLLAADEFDIAVSAAYHSLEYIKKEEKNGWIALFFKKGEGEKAN